MYSNSALSLAICAPAIDADKAELQGAIVLRRRRCRRIAGRGVLPIPVSSFASGWMGVRARARQRGVELPLVISDHADWDELTGTLSRLQPGEVWITHGREDALMRWCDLNGIKARALSLIGYEDEDGEISEAEAVAGDEGAS